jgi:cytidylate kinase
MAPSGRKDRGFASIVERQMRSWEIGREQKEEAKPAESKSRLKFFITISRESGCGAELIAEKIAERTGFEKFDQELLDYMVTKTDVRRQLYETLDDKTIGWIENILSSLSFGPSVDEEEYFNRLCHAVFAICCHTHAVIVGRGINNILPRANGLAVRLVAPFEFRVENYASMMDLDPAAARKEILFLQKRWGQFIENHFGRFAYDPRRFDLFINMAQFTPDEVVDLILESLRAKAGPDFVFPINRKTGVIEYG